MSILLSLMLLWSNGDDELATGAVVATAGRWRIWTGVGRRRGGRGLAATGGGSRDEDDAVVVPLS